MKKPLDQDKEINTDAEASLKGIGLQKVRAVERLLKALLEDKKCIYCTIEHIDDVIEIEMGSETTKYITEQNKAYSKAFSINSEEIKNSLRIFFDNWRKVEQSEDIVFVFYTNTIMAKENKTGILKSIKEKLPAEPLLDLLKQKEYEIAFPFVLPVFKEYYIEQHKKHTDDNTYYEKLIESITDEEWRKFFDLIEWRFAEDNEQKIRDTIKAYVQQLCIVYNADTKYTDKIVASLLYMIESRALEKDFLRKVVHVSEVKNLFLDFMREAKIEEKLDPVHSKWDQVKCEDVRNLEEKINSVCDEFDEDIMQELEDDYIDGVFEQQQCAEIKEVKAYNYRVYKVSQKLIKKFLKEKQDCISQEDIQQVLEQLTDEAEKIILDKSKTYKMPFLDRDMVSKTILILFQECYLAFDEGGVYNG